MRADREELDDDELDIPEPRRAKRRAGEDEDRAGEPGFALILLGACAHALLSLKAALARAFRGRRKRDGENLAPWQYATRRAGPSLDQPYMRSDANFDSPMFDLGAYAPPS